MDTKARTLNDRKTENARISNMLNDNDEWFKRFARRGKFTEETSRREKYQAYGEEHPDTLYSNRHYRKRQAHTELYERMGLTPAATDQEIRDKFQSLAKKYHP